MHVQTPEPGSRRRTLLTLIACFVVAAVAVVAWAVLDSRESSSASPQATEACRMFADLRPTELELGEVYRRHQEIYEASRGAPEVRVAEAARELAELSSPVTVPIGEAGEVGQAAGRLFAACRVAGALPE